MSEKEGRKKSESLGTRKGKSKRLQKNSLEDEEYLSELLNFAFVLTGEAKHLEEIKEYIVQKYVNTELVKLIRPVFDKKEIYIVTDDDWKEYQRLKNKDWRLIGYRIT